VSKPKPPAWITDPDAVKRWEQGYREEKKRRSGKRRRRSGPPVGFHHYVQGKIDGGGKP
jgi:hypothetical protein